jgi:hypothetical protein
MLNNITPNPSIVSRHPNDAIARAKTLQTLPRLDYKPRSSPHIKTSYLEFAVPIARKHYPFLQTLSIDIICNDVQFEIEIKCSSRADHGAPTEIRGSEVIRCCGSAGAAYAGIV